MKQALRSQSGDTYGNLNKFIAWVEAGTWEEFGPDKHHYDWWMVPINRESSHGFKYAVYQEDIKVLKSDTEWLCDYRLGTILLMRSWGWDVHSKCAYKSPASGQHWRKWDVRLGKLAHSLILFGQWDLLDSLAKFVYYLQDKGVTLQKWVYKYIPDKAVVEAAT